MKTSTQLVVCIAIVAALANSRTARAKPFSSPRGTPKSQAISSTPVLVEALDQMDARKSFTLARHGEVMAEGCRARHEAESRQEVYSPSKSFFSTAVGMGIAEGKLSLNDEMLKFFPDDAPAAPSANLKAMHVRDLLTSNLRRQDEAPNALSAIADQRLAWRNAGQAARSSIANRKSKIKNP
jgi:CubicO group peptidase (beta-lactamase class C family)